MNLKQLIHKLRNRWVKLCLKPISVFCLHHVCQQYEAESMHAGDWMGLDEFKQKCIELKNAGAEFISLFEAYHHICHDWFRRKRYAVITFDDGYASIKEVLPWLEEQEIPCTLFINGKYTDGVSFRKKPQEQYLTKQELLEMTSPLIEIGSHGWEHNDAVQLTREEFAVSMHNNVNLLEKHPHWVGFHAYTWGSHNDQTDSVLAELGVVPVLMDGMKNYNNGNCIHRELFVK